MGRKENYPSPQYWQEQPRWYRRYHTEWSGVVGERIRRLRRSRDITLQNVADTVLRPDGGRYSATYFSRLERGSSSPPLYAYLAIATLFDVQPGRLLGPDDAERDATPDEMVVVRYIRRAGISPDAALYTLTHALDVPPPDDREWEPEPKPPPRPVFVPAVAPPAQEIVKSRAELRRLDFGKR
jgi:transcriptional regulator with XRE-family HTH domain